jgi:exopolysaccharide biosynthesis polyprenyl glycosylphosphotransferase
MEILEARSADGPSVEDRILTEREFNRTITRERKRTERSRKPFLLVLVGLDELRSNGNGKALDKILSALALSTRETDVTGWYENSSVVGALFTELAVENREIIHSTMMTRISSTLRDNLTKQQFSQIRLRFLWFPEEWNHKLPDRPSNPALYPDLDHRDDARKMFCVIKRFMDIVGSALALLLFAPVLLAVALAVKLTSEGPVFFRQKRVGQYGKQFVFLKFRSMYVGNDPSVHEAYVKQLIAGKADCQPGNGNGNDCFKMRGDKRITRIGSFLRKTSLDELPQFVNVLRGEMSLVGPRPPIAYEVESYDIWHRRRVLEAKPGITGLWQVNGRSRVKFDDMVRLDLRYAKTWSPWMDVKILLRTPAAVVFGDGAY